MRWRREASCLRLRCPSRRCRASGHRHDGDRHRLAGARTHQVVCRGGLVTGGFAVADAVVGPNSGALSGAGRGVLGLGRAHPGSPGPDREWIALGVFARLKQVALASYDRIVGLVLDQIAIDGSITKAPGGGEVAGRSPVDRGKQGLKRSGMTDGYGIPLGRVLAGANRHDSPLLAWTLLDERGLHGRIAHKGGKAPMQASQRWQVERTHAWQNARRPRLHRHRPQRPHGHPHRRGGSGDHRPHGLDRRRRPDRRLLRQDRPGRLVTIRSLMRGPWQPSGWGRA